MSHGKEIKDSSKSSTKPLKVLVCSANLGNADPSDSFGLWIPDDGYTGKMLRNQNYPIVETEEDWERVGEDTKAADGAVDEDGEDGQSLSQARGGGYYGEQFTEMFDIIVVGLQESTWDPPSEQEASKSNINDDSTGPDADDPSSSHHSVHGAAKKAIKTVEKMTGLAEKAGKKGVSTVNTLSISRDHTKKANEIVPDGTSVLHNLLEARLPSYERILSFQRGEMRLMIYASDRHHKIKLMSVRAQNTGKAGLANKGGIVGEVQVDDTTTLAFMSCHLEAHEGVDKFSTRCSTLGTIFRGTKKYAIPAIYPDASLSSHFSFVLGDLNFRTRHNGCIKVEEQLPGVLKLIADKNWKELNKADELRMALDNQSCLCGFKTPYCNFPPTFKLERREGYFHKDQRTPSYTDRILWRTGDMLQERIKSLLYEPIDDFATSDHKPVRAAFEIRLNHPLEFRRRESTRSTIFGKTSDLKREQLHLFVCDIECDIFPGKDGDQYKPSTYACLVSSPEEVLLAPPTLFEQCCNSVKKFLHINKSSVDIDITSGGNAPTGWPRTPVIKDKLNPKWGQQDIHCILRRHHEDGQPLNLSGAILHLFIFKYNNRHPDEVIGSCPINLELLFRAVAKTDGLSPNPARDSFRKSRSGLFADRTDEQFRIETNDDNIVSMEVNGPLLKNGNQHGVIRCTLDAWWVDEALAGGVSSKPLEMEEGIEDFSEHSQILLSDRIRSGKRKKNHR